MTKRKTSAKPKAKQGKKATNSVTATTETVTTTATATATTSADTLEQSTTTTAQRRANRMNRKQAKTIPLEEEYAYVVNDLRRVFILAGIVFVGLIAANLAFTLLGG
ncbi:MAG: hypothetical protein R3C44_17335 [Chloroflexota bacterium]